MLYSSTNIPYLEYRAIGRLMDAHPSLLNGNLRALIAFGEIVATGESQDIHLLEVIAGWQGPRSASYGSTEALPLRGRLNLYFLTPDEFEQPSVSILEILKRVEPAYAILREEPYEYAYHVMSQIENLPESKAAGMGTTPSDPLSFLRQQTVVNI